MKQLHLPDATHLQTELPSLEPLEVHSGMIFGPRRTPPPPAEALEWRTSNVRETLEEILIPALSRAPCLVSFSGGRDSSAILAMAAQVARRHGLADPVPVTFTYSRHPKTWEKEWQEEMLRHLGLHDWQTMPIETEFDVLGPHAREALERHGLYWPSNAHAMAPLLKAAAGGSLITGNGGDEVFISMVWTKRMSIPQIFRSRRPHDAVIATTIHYLPTAWKVRLQNRGLLRLPWLRPSARREVTRRFVAKTTEGRRTQRHYLERLDGSRYLELVRAIFSALARDAGALLCEPFLDPRFFNAALAQRPPQGFPSRNAGLEAFFGDILPRIVAKRTSKANFTEVFWGPESRDFARHWDGTGLDPTVIDPDKLREEWSKPKPDARAQTPLQAAWLSSLGRR
jgi:asparagine synthetase B (glutamine-hydrolysing)